MVSRHKRYQRIYMTNQLMDNYMYFLEYWLKNVLFRQLVNSMTIESTKQVTLGDQLADAINLLAAPGLYFQCLSYISFWLEF